MPSYAYTMRVVPIDAHRTEMQYDVHRPTDATDEAFDETHKFFVQVEEEDKFLCVRPQPSLARSIDSSWIIADQRAEEHGGRRVHHGSVAHSTSTSCSACPI